MPLSPPVTIQRSKLCQYCADTLSRPLEDWDPNDKLQWIPGTWDASYLITSAREGCRICRLFLESVPVQDLETLFKDGPAMIYLLWDTEAAVFEELTIDMTAFQLAPVTVQESAKPNELLPNHTSSEACWDLAYQWFTNCLLSHAKCHTGQDESFMIPSRLIDVGQIGGQEVRLILTQELESEAAPMHYVTLSHSWMSGPVVKLLKDNIAQFKDRIPLQHLSQTFQDAITVTRKLSIRYLWIDSLCILQDSVDDWQRESSAMRDIYKGCVCNIAATAASKGSDGFFVERNPFAISPFTINIDWKGHQQEYLCFSGAVRYSGFVRAPLNRRGWVMQERLLSTRTIHFSSQIFWECKELEACETYPRGLGKVSGNLIDDGVQHSAQRSRLTAKSWLDEIKTHPASKYSVWVHIVTSFMCCGLTYEEDKLVAMSGIVKEMQPFMDDEYFAGLWKNDLINGLSWYVQSSLHIDGTPAIRPIVYRAPSWSWASVEGRVVYLNLYGLDEPVTPLVTILETLVTPRTADPTGQIVESWIKLRGRPKALPTQIADGEWSGGLESLAICMDDTRPFEDQADLNGIVILPILSRRREETMLIGLLLQPLEAAAGTYRRVGLILEECSETQKMIPGLEWNFDKMRWEIESDEAGSLERTLIIL